MTATTRTSVRTLSVVGVLFCFICAVNGQSYLNTDIGGKRYRIVRQKLNWFEANQACRNLGMSLASLESETDSNNVKKYLQDQNRLSEKFWVSGSNLADAANTDYAWFSSGNALDWTNWATGQPAATTGLCISTDAEFKWTTSDCAATTTADKKYYICSRALIPNCGITGRCKINRNFFY